MNADHGKTWEMPWFGQLLRMLSIHTGWSNIVNKHESVHDSFEVLYFRKSVQMLASFYHIKYVYWLLSIHQIIWVWLPFSCLKGPIIHVSQPKIQSKKMLGKPLLVCLPINLHAWISQSVDTSASRSNPAYLWDTSR